MTSVIDHADTYPSIESFLKDTTLSYYPTSPKANIDTAGQKI